MAVWPMLRIQTSKGETPFSRTSAILFATIEAKACVGQEEKKGGNFPCCDFLALEGSESISLPSK